MIRAVLGGGSQTGGEPGVWEPSSGISFNHFFIDLQNVVKP